MTLTLEHLIDIGVEPTQARVFLNPLKAATVLHDIIEPRRLAAFLAQAMLESSRFTRLEENLFYTAPARIAAVWPSRFKSADEAAPFARNPKALANRVYADRNGNGDEASGDGWVYRGRGLFQLTGRENYRRASMGCGFGVVYVNRPNLVGEPRDAALTAAWYWVENHCNRLIDQGDFDATTRAINGPAMLHAKERRALYGQILEVLK